jgi:hypothetical protein
MAMRIPSKTNPITTTLPIAANAAWPCPGRPGNRCRRVAMPRAMAAHTPTSTERPVKSNSNAFTGWFLSISTANQAPRAPDHDAASATAPHAKRIKNGRKMSE